MKANKIINSINLVINEDKFSKYSMQQIIDELGEEDSFDYLEKTCTKIIRNLNERFMNIRVRNVPHSNYAYNVKYPFGLDNSFEIRYLSQQEKLDVVLWHKTGAYFGAIKVNEPNFSIRLKEELVKCYNSWSEDYGS